MNTNGNLRDVPLEAMALEIKQGSIAGSLYVFAIDGKTIAKQLGVQRMTWHSGKLQGFQRQLDKNRVRVIAQYLGKNPVLPNALVVAFKSNALAFEANANQDAAQPRLGKIVISGKLREVNGELHPLKENERIGYVIDGQHRLKAIEESTLQEGEFPIIVCAFDGVDTRFQLDQFYALNQTVPIGTAHLALLRRQLGYEPPPREAYKKAISDVAGILQEMDGSPFAPETHISVPKIYSGPLSITVLEGVIDRAVKNTQLRHLWKQNAADIPVKELKGVAKGLYVFFKGVSEAFPQYWGKRPKDQRLFSAIGLYAMIMFYDKVMTGLDINSASAVQRVKDKLKPISDVPWGKMQAIPAAPKSTIRPEHLFDAVNDLWQRGGQRPATFKIADPVSGTTLVEIELHSA